MMTIILLNIFLCIRFWNINIIYSSLYDLFDNNFDNEKKARVSGLFGDELVLGSYL